MKMDGRRDAPAPWWAFVLGSVLLLLAFWRTLVWLVASWRGDPYYSHGFVVPLISVFLAWRLCCSRVWYAWVNLPARICKPAHFHPLLY